MSKPFGLRRRFVVAGALVLVPTAGFASSMSWSSSARADDIGSASLAGVTGVGIHNTYADTTDYPYLADALDAGASLIELDTWADFVTNEWKVSHSNPLGNTNNCVDASSSDLYTGGG